MSNRGMSDSAPLYALMIVVGGVVTVIVAIGLLFL